MPMPNFIRFIAAALLAACLSSCPLVPVHAVDSGQWNDVPDNIRSWFKSVRSPHGVPCCDIADGHRTAYDIRSQGGEEESGYWVPIEGDWYSVPKSAVVYNAGNPVGEAIVWYVKQGEKTFYIRCFVPGGGA